MKKVIANVLEFVSKYKSYIIIVIILITSCISLILEQRVVEHVMWLYVMDG